MIEAAPRVKCAIVVLYKRIQDQSDAGRSYHGLLSSDDAISIHPTYDSTYDSFGAGVQTDLSPTPQIWGLDARKWPQ